MAQERFCNPDLGIPTDVLCFLWLMYFELVVISESANKLIVCTQFCPEYKEMLNMGSDGAVSIRFKGTFTNYHKKYNAAPHNLRVVEFKKVTARKSVAFKPQTP